MDRIGAGLSTCVKMGIIYSLAALVVLALTADKLALLFVNADETQLIHYIYMYCVGNASFFIGLALVNIVRFMIQGLGYPTFAIIAGVCEMVARAVAGFVLVPHFGFICVSLASPLAWLCADIFLIPAYLWVSKQLKKKFSVEAPVPQAS
jgi:O-antigen/teichoic acid export membrane protein